MPGVNLPCTVRLVRLITPSLLMAIAMLSLIDCLNAFLDPNFVCIPVKPLNIYLGSSERKPVFGTSNLGDHGELRTTVVFLVEMFAGLVNFLTGGLYLLLTFCCLTTKLTVGPTLGRRVRVPFPRISDEHSQLQFVSFIEFSSFLAAVAGSFGALMMITTMSLRYRSMGGEFVDSQFSDDQIHFIWNVSHISVHPSPPLCHVYRTSGLANAIIMLCVDIVLVTTTILSKRVSVYKVQDSEEFGNFNRTKTEDYSLLSTNTWAKKVACFCLDLTRLILMLASVLITCGGLNILGGALQLLQVDYTSLSYTGQTNIRSKMKEVFCIFNGILALCCGLFAVTSIHCCSTPLEVLFSEVYELYGKSARNRHRFGWFAHLLTISLGLVTLPVSSGSYILLRVDFTDYSRLGLTGALKTSSSSSGSMHTREVLRVGYSLSCFASLIAFLVSSMLIVCLLVDIYLRIRLMDRHQSLLSVCINRVDKTLSGSFNQLGANANHYFVNWKESEPSSMTNKPPFDGGAFVEIENHLMPVGNHRHIDDPNLPVRGFQSEGKLPIDQAGIMCPLSGQNNCIQLRAVTPHYLSPESHYITEVGFRPSGVAEGVYHRPDLQNHLIYTCDSSSGKAGGVSSTPVASTLTTTSFMSPPPSAPPLHHQLLQQQEVLIENQDCVCEYMSCEIECYPETVPEEDPVAAAVGHVLLPDLTSPDVTGESPQPLWYYDIGGLGEEGTFTSV